MTSSSLIKIFTYKLPKHLARPMYTEFNNRYSEAMRLIEGYSKYSILKEDTDTVELLLALSIFYKQVITNLDAAIKFYGLVVKNKEATAIHIGSYVLNDDEIFKIQKLLNLFHLITSKYNLAEALWNYNLTLEFLQRLIDLKHSSNE